jgi:hypothetical protein
MFRALLAIIRRHYTNAELMAIVGGYRSGLVSVFEKTNSNIQLHTSHQSYIRVVSPDDGQVMPEICRDFEP